MIFDGEFKVRKTGQRVTVKTGDLSKKTILKSAVLGITLPVLSAIIHNNWELTEMLIDAAIMVAVVVSMDAMKPVHIYHNN